MCVDDGGGAGGLAGGQTIHYGDGTKPRDKRADGARRALVAHRKHSGAGATRAAKDKNLATKSAAIDAAERERTKALALLSHPAVNGRVVVV